VARWRARLGQLLEEGVTKGHRHPLEQGKRRIHPPMSAFPLIEDEVVTLADYLQTFATAEATLT
jgi:hypothetical protein